MIPNNNSRNRTVWGTAINQRLAKLVPKSWRCDKISRLCNFCLMTRLGIKIKNDVVSSKYIRELPMKDAVVDICGLAEILYSALHKVGN